MAHDSRCGDATTDVQSCDCDCGGKLHGIENKDSDHSTHVITDDEERIFREFDKRFSPKDVDRIIQNDADVAAWDQLVEEKPEMAKKLQEAEDNPDLDFSVGDIYWEAEPLDRDRRSMAVITPFTGDDLSKEEYDELEEAAYDYMVRHKANQFSMMADKLRELYKVSTEKAVFPESRDIRSSIEEANDDRYDPQERLYDAKHRFGDLNVKRIYKKSEDGDELIVDTKYVSEDGEVVGDNRTEHDLNEINDVKKFIKANHNADPQNEFREFGE